MDFLAALSPLLLLLLLLLLLSFFISLSLSFSPLTLSLCLFYLERLFKKHSKAKCVCFENESFDSNGR